MALERITSKWRPADSDPIVTGAAVTPSDSTDLSFVTRGINVAVAGNVKIELYKNTTVTLYLVAGVIHPIRACRIWATGTTATGIVGLA